MGCHSCSWIRPERSPLVALSHQHEVMRSESMFGEHNTRQSADRRTKPLVMRMVPKRRGSDRRPHPKRITCSLSLAGRREPQDGTRCRWSVVVWWACQDLNLGPHPERRIARVATGSATPRRAELGRAARFSSLVAAPGHGVLSATDREPLCGPTFLQVACDRRCQSYRFNRRAGTRSRVRRDGRLSLPPMPWQPAPTYERGAASIRSSAAQARGR
jgi:hypothetical protein